MADIIVLRDSPDWLTFDVASARPFMRERTPYSEDTLERFVELWDAGSAVDFRTFRHRLKIIALRLASAGGRTVVSHRDIRDLAPDDRLIFMDDDDWLAPGLFAKLPDCGGVGGIRWGSIRIGLDYDPTAPGAAMIQLRRLSQIVYTNNYAVMGSTATRLGLDAVFDHSRAHSTFAREDVVVIDSPDYLSCAVKHPCSATAAGQMMRNPLFVSDPAAAVHDFAARLDAAAIPDPAAWMAEPLEELRALFREASAARQ